MKKIFLLALLSLFTAISCSTPDGNEDDSVGESKEAYIDASKSGVWNYYSLSENRVVGSGAESDADNALWFARKDWDFAVNKYNIRTNSGAATSIASKGGIYKFDATIEFASITELPQGVIYAVDTPVVSEGMGGTTTKIMSAATVILFKTNDDGSMIMPPVYLQAPVYMFRTADGINTYKVKFTQYLNESSASGHVKLISAQIK